MKKIMMIFYCMATVGYAIPMQPDTGSCGDGFVYQNKVDDSVVQGDQVKTYKSLSLGFNTEIVNAMMQAYATHDAKAIKEIEKKCFAWALNSGRITKKQFINDNDNDNDNRSMLE